VKPRALHRTTSVFLRNIAPAITKSELETVCNFYLQFFKNLLLEIYIAIQSLTYKSI